MGFVQIIKSVHFFSSLRSRPTTNTAFVSHKCLPAVDRSPVFAVLSGNVDMVEVSYTQGESADPIQLGSEEYVEDRSTPDSRTIILKPFIRANTVTIAVKKAADDQQDSYNLHLSIYGCFDTAGKLNTLRA